MTAARTRFLLTALICLVPVFPLFQLGVSYGTDWTNHLWLVTYYSEYLKHYRAFPVTLFNNQVVGIPFPLFYANILYEFLSVPSLVLGAAISVRIALYLALCLQFVYVRAASRSAIGDKPVTWVVAALWTWCIYPMTNVYNRSALPEFFSVVMLVCAVCSLFMVIRDPEKGLKSPNAVTMGLFLSLAASIHPITAMVGTGFIAVIALVSMIGEKRRKALLLWYVLSGAGFAMVLSNFIYIYAEHGKDLLIQSAFKPLAIFDDSIDWIVERFTPIPFDVRVGKMDIKEVSTAYLEAPLSVPLLLLVLFFGYFIWKKRKNLPAQTLTLFSVACFLFVFITWMSVNAVPWAIMPKIMYHIEFTYRLVTYINISLLIAVFAALSLLKGDEKIWSRRLTKPFLIFLFALNLIAVGVKINHGTVFADPRGELEEFKLGGSKEDVVELPDVFYGYGNFKTVYVYPFLYARPEFMPFQLVYMRMGRGDHFAEPQPLTVTTNKEQYVRTNVFPFPWNVLYVDGKRADPVYVTDDLLTLQLPKGTHEVTLKEEPDPVYVGLNFFSIVVVILWAAAALYQRFAFKRSLT